MDLPTWEISREERTRNEALFYRQKPQNGFLSGEQARALFIRSKLPLPELSKIWKLADITRDNILDISEFIVAMHLIQSRLRGMEIPQKLPQNLMPIGVTQLEVPAMSQAEKDAYDRAFAWRDNDKTGFLSAEIAKTVVVPSGLPGDVLARIWDLSDIDRDGQLSSEEFAIALHLVRFCRKGNSLDGSIDAAALLPHKTAQDIFDSQKERLAEVQTEKRRFLSLKEKLCHEIAGGLTEDIISQNIRPELNRVEGQLHFLEKEENELRRSLQHAKEKSKRESCKPFDRSFLLKRRACGEDIFRGTEKNGTSDEDDGDFEEKLLMVGNSPVSADEHVTSESPDCSPEVHPGHEEQPNDTDAPPTPAEHERVPSDQRAEVGEQETIPVANGVEKSVSGKLTTDDHRPTPSDESTKVWTHETIAAANGVEESASGDLTTDTADLAVQDGPPVVEAEPEEAGGSDGPSAEERGDLQAPTGLEVSESSENSCPTVDSYSVKEQLVNGEGSEFENNRKTSEDEEIVADTKLGPPVVCVNLNKLDEKFELLDKEADQQNAPVKEEAVVADTAVTAESSPESNMNSISQDHNKSNGFRDDVIMRRQPTQEELLPFFLEEKRKKDEERRKKRLVEEEQVKRAREELKVLEERHVEEMKSRKASFREGREKLERQTLKASAGDGEQTTKVPLSRTEASLMVERELEEQRNRELETQKELVRIKELQKRELEKEKTSKPPVWKEEHPAAYKKRSSIIEKPILDGDVKKQGETNGTGSERRDGRAQRLAETKARESDHVSEPQVVRRRPKPRNDNAEEKASNRKSIVELEIERQRAREQDMKQESEKRQQEMQRHKEAEEQSVALLRRDSEDMQKQRQEAETKEQEARRIQDLVRKHSRGDMLESATVANNVYAPPDVGDEIDAALRLDEQRRLEDEQTRVEVERERKRKEDVEKAKSEALKREADQLMRDKRTQEEEMQKRRELEEERRLEEERERRRREEIERVRKEALKREAEQLVREKKIREEELQKKREAQLREAEKRGRERKVAAEQESRELESRRASFHAHKVMLEQRVLKAMQEGSGSGETVMRRAQQDKSERENTKGKRYSLNLNDTPELSTTQPEVRLRNKAESKSNMRDRSTFYADQVVARDIQVAIDTGEAGSLADAMPKLSERRKQFERGATPSPPPQSSANAKASGAPIEKGKSEPPARRPQKAPAADEVDARAQGIPSIGDDKIRRELEEQRRREELLRQETEFREREKKRDIEEEERKKLAPRQPSHAVVDKVERAVSPSRLQVRKPSRSRDSLTQSMAAQWESYLSAKDAGLPSPTTKQPFANTERKTDEQKKSFIELERERERQRELEIQREHEALQRERQRKIDEQEAERRKKEDDELENKRKVSEEKEKRQQRTSAMKSMWERMSSKN